jgi:hypothetical protein
MSTGLKQFIEQGRLRMTFDGRTLVRAVHQSEIDRVGSDASLDTYIAERLPYFYREPKQVARLFGEGYFLSAIKRALERLPTAETFQSSHFAEILAAVYAEEMLGLRRLYSKLALTTAENTNAYKMDVLLYDPLSDPVEFVFAEVKSSMKTSAAGLPAGHDKSCFADLFTSFNAYKDTDLEFDLGAIKDRMTEVPAADAARITEALLPYHARRVRYAGFCVIDSSTHSEDEAAVLATRRNKKTFDVDLLCVTELPAVASSAYELLFGTDT